MIQHVSRTTFPALFRSGSERTGIGGGDHEDGSARRCVVPHKMTFNRFSSSLRKTPLFRSSSSYKTKHKNTKNSTTSKDDHGMRTDAPTVTQLTPSPHYAARPVLTTEQPPPGGNHRSIPTVPELCIPNINTSTITNTTNKNNNNRSSSSSSSSSRSQQLRLARIYSSRRSIEDEEEQEHEQADDDHPDFPWEESTSFLFQSPPIQVVEIPPDFTHATAFGVTTERKQNTTVVRNNSSSSHNSTTNVVRRVLDRPPPRFGDWDDHTIASTTSCAKDVVMTDDSRAGGSTTRTAATVSVQTARDVITSFVDRRQRRRRTRSIRSIPMTTPAPMTNKNHGPPPQQQQEHQWNENSEQQQLRGVKWNRVPPQHTTASPQPLPPGQPRVVRWNMVQPQPQPESEQQQQQQPPRVVKWNSVR